MERDPLTIAGPRSPGLRARLLEWLPRGGGLGPEQLAGRHRWVVGLLWLHVPAILAFGLIRHQGLRHSITEAVIVAVSAAVAGVARGPRAAPAMGALGLVVSSSVLVHLSGGVTEAHFHFFVAIAVLTLYEEWVPFILALGYVFVHHGVVGKLDPVAVYSHPAATARPWTWAAIHAGFVLAASAVSVIRWKVNETSRAAVVTEQLAAQEALREAEERFRMAFDNAPIGIGLVGLDGRWLRVNEALANIVGYGPDELLEMTVRETTHPDDLGSDLALLEQLTAGQIDRYQIDKRYIHRAGHEVWVRLHASMVRDGAGEPLHSVLQVEDATQRKQSEMMLTHMAMHDSLTGLPNRTLALDRLGQALARSKRSGSRVAVLFCDLDRFKVINDSLGHAAGDRLLMAAATRLRALLRPSDTIARIGGDEFVLVCDDVEDGQGAERIAQRVLSAMVAPFDLGDDQVVVGTSVGVALADGTTSPEDLIRDADAAMYRAKEAGRSRYELFDASFRTEAVSRLETEQDLRRAIDRGEFRLHYQPLIDLEDGATVGVEALLRWEHPTKGTIAPLEFIPLAEDTGLIVPIGTWVIQEACRQAKAWRDEDRTRPQLRIAVNLSARQLAQADLADVVARALEETGTDPSSLVLEITESVLTDDTEATVEALRALKALGVRLSVDDFGTGYSSLLYLKRFPVDILKVDRSFVEGLGTDPEDSAIVAGVVGLARTLGLATVAEGVETEKQLHALRELGCGFAQGFLFARPQLPEDVQVSSVDIRVPA